MGHSVSVRHSHTSLKDLPIERRLRLTTSFCSAGNLFLSLCVFVSFWQLVSIRCPVFTIMQNYKHVFCL